MQALLLEELRPSQIGQLRAWLAGHSEPAALADTYWLALPGSLLTCEQRSHLPACGPFCLALILDERRASLRLELLVRARQSLHCSCMAMSDLRQRAFALDFWDKMLEALAL